MAEENKKPSFLDSINETYEKFHVIIKLLVMVIPLLYATYTYLKSYIDLPKRMDRFEERANRDSINLLNKYRRDSVYFYYKFHKNDSALLQHNAWADSDEVHISKLEKKIFGKVTIK